MQKIEFEFLPHSPEEKFGIEIYFLLVENFPKTFLVGGVVRNKILNIKCNDIDIATSAAPEEVIKILNSHKIEYDSRHKKFGVILAHHKNLKVEITTFRLERYNTGRFPDIEFTNNIYQDSKRRDFTINALYLSLKESYILDYHHGLEDVKNRRLKFIGNPQTKIIEDPLRIIRAIRFMHEYNLIADTKTHQAIKKYFYLTSQISRKKILSELEKISDKKIFLKLKNYLQKNLDISI